MSSTLFTRRQAVGLLALSIASAGLAGPAHARERAPTVRVVKDTGKDVAANFEWDISRVEISGLANTFAQRRVNAALRREVEEAKRVTRGELKSWEGPGAVGVSSGLWIEMGVGVATRRLLSVSITTSTYYAGAAHPNTGICTLTFDLRTGNKVAVRSLFRAGEGVMEQVAQRVDAALRASGDYALDGEHFLETVTAEHIHAVRVEQDGGMTFLFGNYEIGPYAAGLPSVTLSAADLRGLLATDGPAASVTAATPAPRAASRGLTGSVPVDPR